MFNTKWTIYIVISKIIKTSDPRSLVLNLANKIDLKKNDKIFALSNLSIYYTWENIKRSCKKNEFKISASTWLQLELLDGPYSVSSVQDYFESVITNMKCWLMTHQ